MSASALSEIAGHPLALIAFGIWLLVGLTQTIITSGILPAVSKQESAKVLSRILVGIFIFGLLLFALAFISVYKNQGELSRLDHREFAIAIVEALEKENSLAIPRNRAEEILAKTVLTLEGVQNQSQVEIDLERLLEGDLSMADRLLTMQFESERNKGALHFERAAEYAHALGELKSVSSIADAIPHYQQAYALNPSADQYLNSFAQALWEAGRIDEAIFYFQSYAEEQLEDPSTWNQIKGNLLLVSLSTQGLLCDEALEYLCNAGRLLNAQAEEHGIQGFSFDSETCEMEFDRAGKPELDPTQAAMELRAQVQFSRGAESEFALAQNLFQLGEHFRNNSDNKEAITTLLDAKKICIENDFQSILPDVYFELAKSYVHFQEMEPAFRYQKAMNAVRSGIQAARDYESELSVIYGHSLAGWVSLSFGQQEQASRLYRRAYDSAIEVGLIGFAAGIAVQLTEEVSDEFDLGFVSWSDYHCNPE